MKFFAAAVLASIAAASPVVISGANDIEARQFGIGSKNELESGQAGACPKAIMIFARGSTEQGNLVRHPLVFPYVILNINRFITSHPYETPSWKRSMANNQTGHTGRPSRKRPRAEVRCRQCLGAGCRWTIHGRSRREQSASRLFNGCHCRGRSSVQDGQRKMSRYDSRSRRVLVRSAHHLFK
jgi:hypothetical protein